MAAPGPSRLPTSTALLNRALARCAPSRHLADDHPQVLIIARHGPGTGDAFKVAPEYSCFVTIPTILAAMSLQAFDVPGPAGVSDLAIPLTAYAVTFVVSALVILLV